MSDISRCLKSLSVVIPAYNAEGHLTDTLTDVRDWLEHAQLPHEIIVVDDGSADATAATAERFGHDVRVLRNPINRGKGYTVRRGMLETRHDWALFMDVDNSTRITHLERFAALADAHDVLIASRRVAGARIVRPQPRLRQLLGRCFPLLAGAIARPGVLDSQCGFKLFRRAAALDIFARQRVDRFAFDVELLLLARRLDLRIAEVPVDWDNPADSTLQISSDSTRMLLDVIRTTWRLRGKTPPPIAAPPDHASPG